MLWTEWFMSTTTAYRHKMSVISRWLQKSSTLLHPFNAPFTVKSREPAPFFPRAIHSGSDSFSVTLPLFFSPVEGSRRRRKWIWWVLTNAWANGWNVNMLPVITHARLKAALETGDWLLEVPAIIHFKKMFCHCMFWVWPVKIASAC